MMESSSYETFDDDSQAPSRFLQEAIDPSDPRFANFSVQYVLPFSNHDNVPLMLIASVYAILFVFGTCGNAAILAVVHHVKATGTARSRHNTTLTYICVLCIVDFLSMLPLPMTIIDQVLGFWMFGTFACKLFRLLEHIGKIFSTFILVAFSIDRYLAVCHPLKSEMRTARLVYCMLGTMFSITCLLLSPILLYAHSKELIINDLVEEEREIITRLHLFKCIDDLGDDLFIAFTLYTFVFAYLVPLLLMIYFYYAMLKRLFEQYRKMDKSLYKGSGKRSDDKIPIIRIAVYTFAICLFHFICWTPYWCSVLHSLWQEISQSIIVLPSPGYVYVMYGIHALPYINSASNFILYGLLNRQLHQPHGRRSGSRSTRGGGRVVSAGTPALRFNGGEAASNGGVGGGGGGGGGMHAAASYAVTDSPSVVLRTPPSETATDKAAHERSPLVVVSNGKVSPRPETPNGVSHYASSNILDEDTIMI